MSALRTSRNVTPAQPLLRRATAVHVLPLGQRCMRMIPQARVKQQEELGLVLSDLEREYFREVSSGQAEAFNAAAPSDFFQLLNLDLGASAADIKQSYRALQRLVHPDLIGDDANEVAVLLNIAYATLMNDALRETYQSDVQKFRKDGHAYDGRPVSRWNGMPEEQRAVFVDETSCTGCFHCANMCPQTFHMEDDYGRARVHTQWGNDAELIEEAIEMCPVDCIAYVNRDQLALLEFVLKSCHREDSALMGRRRSGNLGSKPNKHDPFKRAEIWLRHRKNANKVEETALWKSLLTEETAAAMARAWLALPEHVKEKGWPEFVEANGRVAFFGR